MVVSVVGSLAEAGPEEAGPEEAPEEDCDTGLDLLSSEAVMPTERVVGC